MGVELKTASEIATMREAGRVVAVILRRLVEETKPGVTTGELDAIAHELIQKHGAKPAFLGYRGYPCVLCASVNEEVVHGIPSKKRKLKEGDIIGLDFGVVVDGFYADSAYTVPVGTISDEARRLVDVTRQALERGIAQAKVGGRVQDIGGAIQAFVEEHDYEVVRDFVGHGIGRRLHEEPQVPNYGPAGQGMRLKPGMVLAIEPMVNAGTHEVEVLDDDWTAVTLDGKLSAHFEHTIAITEDGPVILTLP
jgi:methionyl aminopeptidase